jgi:hypothetical protein
MGMTAYRPASVRFARRLGRGVFGSQLEVDVRDAAGLPTGGPVLLEQPTVAAARHEAGT